MSSANTPPNPDIPHNMAMYRMEHNRYLGDSIAIAFQASDEEVAVNGMTSAVLAAYLKPARDISTIPSLRAIASAEIFDTKKPIPLRIASSCEFGVFGDTHCDCEEDRIAGLKAIQDNGQGIYVQLPQEALGQGLVYKAKELEIQVHGALPDGAYIGPKDVFEAAAILGVDQDFDRRKFGIVGKLFDELGIKRYSYTLLTSNPQKAANMAEATGITITGNMAVATTITPDNIGVYLAKIQYGETLSVGQLRSVLEVLESGITLPPRSTSLLKGIDERLLEDTSDETTKRLLSAIAAYRAP